MIEYIFFDIGGVLSTDTELSLIEEIATKLNLDNDLVKSAFKKHSMDFQKGRIFEDTFWGCVLASTGLNQETSHTLNIGDIYSKYTKIIETNVDIANRMRERNNRTGIITNTVQALYDYHIERGLLDGFDPVISSYDVGFIKPEFEIYKLATEKVGKKPGSCLFIDDKENFVQGALDFGMRAIHYTTPTKLEEELRELGLI